MNEIRIIELSRIYHEDLPERAVFGCLDNVGMQDSDQPQLPARGICPVNGREIVLNDAGFCMSAECDRNYTVPSLLNYSEAEYKELLASLKENQL